MSQATSPASPSRVGAPAEQAGFVVASRAMTELLAMAARAAKSPAKVLITGESGVGKDVVARYIHSQSIRRQAQFVAVNCAGVTETLLESELFGHVKGSFTGAYRDKPGKLESADLGTMFLDEVGEMTLRMQGLLLRFLETGELQKVGADHRGKLTNVRIIAATGVQPLPEPLGRPQSVLELASARHQTMLPPGADKWPDGAASSNFARRCVRRCSRTDARNAVSAAEKASPPTPHHRPHSLGCPL